MSGREWGASCSALKRTFMALIRSVVDYDSIAYGSAARCHLKKLDVIQAQALRVCSAAFTTLPLSGTDGRDAAGVEKEVVDGELLGKFAGTQ